MAVTTPVETAAAGPPPERKRSILALPLIAALPVLVFAAAAFAFLSEAQQEALERDILQLARYSGQAGDLLLEERLSTLNALASLAADGDASDFDRQARLILMTRPDWRAITVRDAAGRLLAAESRPGEPTADGSVDLASAPPGSAVVIRPDGDVPHLLARTITRRPGQPALIITARLDLEPFSEALRGLTNPDWTLALLDPLQVIAGRSRNPATYVGNAATPSLKNEIAAARERFFYATNQEGQRVYTAFSTSRRTGWTAAIGAPAELVEASLRRARLGWIAGGVVAVLVAMILAWALSQVILRRHAAERQAWQLESERKAEARLSDIARHFPGVMYRRVLHPDGTVGYPYVSPGAADLLGAEPDQLFGTRPLEQLARDRISPEDRAAFVEAMRSSAETLSPFTAEVRAIRADGSVSWIRSTATARRTPGGSVVWDGVMTDISALKASESRLKDRTEALRATSRVNTTIASELDRDKLVQAVLDAGRAMTGAAFGAFFYNVPEEAGEPLMLYKLSGASYEDFRNFPMPRSTEIFGPTLRGEGVIRLADVTKDPRYGRNAPNRGMPDGHLPVRSYLAAPVISRSDEVLGGLFFGHPHAGVFDETAEEVVTGLSGQAAVALENARLFKAAEDEIARRRRVEAQQKMLLAELNHRVKNTLAVVLAIAQQTAKTSPSLGQFAAVFQGRIMALANAHTLLTAGDWQSTNLHALVTTALEPHAAPDDERITVGGPQVVVPPRQALALSLVLHEMATNASKYGALSGEGGGIAVEWAPDGPDLLSLRWTERTAAHRAAQPGREGFGTRLITMNVTRELGGTVSRDYAPEGFRAEIRLPWNPETGELVSEEETNGESAGPGLAPA